MKSLVRNICSLLDIMGMVTLLVAGGCLTYAISIPEVSLAGQYFNNFFPLLWGAVLLFGLSRIFQLLEFMLVHSLQANASKAGNVVYQTAKSAR